MGLVYQGDVYIMLVIQLIGIVNLVNIFIPLDSITHSRSQSPGHRFWFDLNSLQRKIYLGRHIGFLLIVEL